MQSTGQCLLGLLRIHCLQVNYISNIYCCLLSTQQVFSLKHFSKAKLPVSEPLSLLSPWLDSPGTSQDGTMLAWQGPARGCWLWRSRPLVLSVLLKRGCSAGVLLLIWSTQPVPLAGPISVWELTWFHSLFQTHPSLLKTSKICNFSKATMTTTSTPKSEKGFLIGWFLAFLNCCCKDNECVYFL